MPTKSWRALGYVPDSDDEDDISTINTQNSSPIHLKIQISHPIAKPSQESPRVETVVDVLVPFDQVDATLLTNVSSSSELSELSDCSLPSPIRTQPTENALTNISVVETPSETHAETGQNWVQRFTERSLRPRRSEQLHPYTIEQEKYRQAFRARGLRPVQIQDDPQIETEEEQEPDKAYSSEEESQIPQPSAIWQSSSPKVPSSRVVPNTIYHDVPNEHRSSSQTMIEYADEFPDLLTILARRKNIPGNVNARPHKRRKIASDHTLATRQVAPGRSPGYEVSDIDVFDIPEAPKQDQRPSRARSGRKFHMPAPLSALPGSFCNSTIMEELSHRTAIQISDGSNSEISQTDDEHSTNEPLLESKEAVQSLGRKIRGVLPRSFATLDFERQKAVASTQTTKVGHQRIAAANSPVRGIARPARKITTRTLMDMAIPGFVGPESDDEQPEIPCEDLPQPRLQDESCMRTDFAVLDPGPSMEDDAIDFLGPSLSRARNKQQINRTKSSSSRQLRLEESLKDFHTPSDAIRNRKTVSTRRRINSGAIRKSRSTTKRRRHMPANVQLGILDVEDSILPGSTIPDFLRIARRQARKDRNFGRHSPSTKYFRLQTMEDTADANELLISWGNGALRQKSIVRERIRKLLHDRSGNPRIQSDSGTPSDFAHTSERASDARLPVPHDRSKAYSDSTLRSRRNITYKQRKLQSFVTRTEHPAIRTAQLESLEKDIDVRNHRSTFQSRLRRVNQEFKRNIIVDSMVGRTMSSDFKTIDNSHISMISPSTHAGDVTKALNHQNPIHRQVLGKRNRRVQRKLMRNREFRQPEQESIADFSHVPDYLDDENIPVQIESSSFLTGFRPSYSIDFDIHPLPQGTFFRSSTFVGSGDFRSIITLHGRDLSVDVGNHIVWFGTAEYSWGPWGHEMERQTRDLMKNFYNDREMAMETSYDEDLHSSSPATLNAITDAIRLMALSNAKWMSFSNTSDSSRFSSVLAQSLAPLLTLTTIHLNQQIKQHSRPGSRLKAFFRLILVQLSLCTQMSTAAKENSFHTGPDEMILHASQSLLDFLFASGTSSIRNFLDHNADHEIREKGIGDECLWVETIVVLHHVLAKIGCGLSFWGMVTKSLQHSIASTHQISVLEIVWHDIMAILPLLEIRNCYK